MLDALKTESSASGPLRLRQGVMTKWPGEVEVSVCEGS